MVKITSPGLTLPPKKQKELSDEVEKCLRDSLKKTQDITEIVIKIKTT